MALSTQPYKGSRDFYPEDKRLQKHIFGVMRSISEKYGYQEYDSPILEPTEIYSNKTNEEIVNEQTYTFEDRGNRKVTIRPEMTPSVSRMVAAKRQELPYPLRWYSLPVNWRYERPQRGRLREFWQLNVDLFGIAGLEAEAEVIQVADDIMKAFGAKPNMYKIKINSRNLMDYFISDSLGMDSVQSSVLVPLIDRMHKMDFAEFSGQVEAIFTPTQRENSGPDQLFEFLKITSIDDLPISIKNHPSVITLVNLIKRLTNAGITNAVFDPTLMRGFNYYTDVVFEVFDTHPDNNRSMFGGGRYDGLVGAYGVESVPTVGFGMGDVTIYNFLESHGLTPTVKTETDVCAIIIGDTLEPALKIISELREMGLNVAVASTEQKIDKQIKIAVKNGIKFAVFLGEKEIKNQQVLLKNLENSTEEIVSSQRAVSIIKDFRIK